MGAIYKDEYDSYVSMHHTDAAGVVYIGAPIGWAQVGLENLFRAVGHSIESLKLANIHYPMVRQVISHQKSLHLGEPVRVTTWIGKVGTRSYTVVTDITAPDGTPHVSVELTGVAKGRAGTKPPVEDWIRDTHTEAIGNGLRSLDQKEN